MTEHDSGFSEGARLAVGCDLIPQNGPNSSSLDRASKVGGEMRLGVADQTEGELVRRARGGDAAALDKLVSQHAPLLYRLAFSLVGRASDAEDVVQETLLAAVRQLSGFEGRSSFKTWLSRILFNRAATFCRSRAVRRTSPLQAAEGETVGRHRGSAHSGAGVDHRVDVATMLQTLSAEHREVLVLRELQGMSYEEIAETLAIPRGTVESRLYRARQQLKERFEGYL
jgi:RNA polymerase sigma-70 factor (ECF subfamily)